MQLVLHICPISSDNIQLYFVTLHLSIQPKSNHMTHTSVHLVLKKKKKLSIIPIISICEQIHPITLRLVCQICCVSSQFLLQVFGSHLR